MRTAQSSVHRRTGLGVVAARAALAGVLTLSACNDGGTAGGDAGSPTDRLVAALGGRDAIEATTNERITASGERFDPGESSVPGTTWLVSEFTMTATTELGADRARTELNVDVAFPRRAELAFTEVRSGGRGYVAGHDNVFAVGPTPPLAIPAARVASAEKHADLVSPLRLLRRALAEERGIRADGLAEVDGKELEVLRITLAGRPDVRMFLDPASHLPVKSETTEDHPPVGDATVEAIYGDYRKVDALTLPHAVTLRVDGLDIHKEVRSKIELNVGTDADFYALLGDTSAAPHDHGHAAFAQRSSEWLLSFEFMGLPIFYDIQTGTPKSAELAPGVHLLTGTTHHSLLIEMSDHVVLVERTLSAPTAWSRRRSRSPSTRWSPSSGSPIRRDGRWSST
ncbi:hypothetical protein [Sorangium sp. So ce381]|uniref:hypothetical protein n=1 Tax=Sorangium sp. So ce381 TaxID=3133307 RepID=UPI003F5C0E72